jgi:hypothetical protein
MDRGLVAPDWAPLVELLHHILTRLRDELVAQEPICLSVATNSVSAGFLRLATLGEGGELIDAQVGVLGGPVSDALATGLPSAVSDVWDDPRWPELTRSAMVGLDPERAETWDRIRGFAVLPAGHAPTSTVVLSCCLAGTGNEATLTALDRYKQLVESAVAVVHAASVEGPEKTLNILAGRAVIEQAKGAIIAATSMSSAQAWQALRMASQHHNVKLRDLATALIFHLSGTTGPNDGLPPLELTPDAKAAAASLWQALTT